MTRGEIFFIAMCTAIVCGFVFTLIAEIYHWVKHGRLPETAEKEPVIGARFEIEVCIVDNYSKQRHSKRLLITDTDAKETGRYAWVKGDGLMRSVLNIAQEVANRAIDHF
jgi:hypothetical protein